MVKYSFYAFLLLSLVSCNDDSRKVQNDLIDENVTPIIVELDTVQGYNFNKVKEDTIPQVFVSENISYTTGQPLDVTNNKILRDTLLPPQDVTHLIEMVGTAEPNNNVHSLIPPLPSRPIPTNNFKTQLWKNDTIEHNQLLVGKGDTVTCGTPVKIDPVITAAKQPKIINALKPSSKFDASNDIKYLNTEHGLPGSMIHSIIQDKKGRIWMSVFLAGVIMYDGQNFYHYTPEEGLCSNYTYQIFEDSEENIWICSPQGISKFDGNNFYTYYAYLITTSIRVKTIFEDSNNTMWFGTQGGGLLKFDGEYFTHLTPTEGLPSLNVTSVVEDKEGIIWISHYAGLSSFDGESFTNYSVEDGLPDQYIMTLFIDQDENLWMGSWRNGLCKMTEDKFIYYSLDQGLSSNRINDIKQDKEGNIWIATNAGVDKITSNEIVNYQENSGLTNVAINTLCIDDKGNIWMGGNSKGVCILNTNSFQHFSYRNQMNQAKVRSIVEMKDSAYWMTIEMSGNNYKFGRYNGNKIEFFDYNDPNSNMNPISIEKDEEGNIYMGTLGGLLKFDGKKWLLFQTPQGLTNNKLRKVFVDSKNRIWVAAQSNGLCMFDGEYVTQLTMQNSGFTGNAPMSFAEDKDGNIWIGSQGGGLAKYVDNRIINYTEMQGLSDNLIYTLHSDKSGNIWIGTVNAGISCFNGTSFANYTTKHGLSNLSVRGIQSDENGNIWATTDLGVNYIDIKGDPFDNNYRIHNYRKKDGLSSAQYYENGIFLDSKNQLWIAGYEGIELLDLNKFNNEGAIPDLLIHNIEVNDKKLDFRHLDSTSTANYRFKDIAQFTNLPQELELDHHQNHLKFYFSATEWSSPSKIEYSYKLIGYSTDWSEPSANNFAEFTNLSQGSYELQVRTKGENQIWSDIATFEFEILPPWWNTWWARALYAISAVLLILGFVRWRTAKLKRRQIELETEVRIATKEILEQKKEIENSHFETQKQKEIIEEAHKEITDSINYAERIQRSFLATEDLLNSNLGEHFVYFNPKEAVSGDFYWAGELANGDFALSCADSTGHGVPGAIMSILNISSIEKAVEKGSTNPAVIFNQTRGLIIERLKNDGSPEGGKDGMDASLIVLNPEKTRMKYVAAHNPIWIIRDGELIDIKAEKMPVGKHDHDQTPFKGGAFDLQKGDIIYSMTDGFQDQFGGDKGKKFKVKPLKRMLLEMTNLSMEAQLKKISDTFEEWKGSLEQVDDVCIIGIKV